MQKLLSTFLSHSSIQHNEIITLKSNNAIFCVLSTERKFLDLISGVHGYTEGKVVWVYVYVHCGWNYCRIQAPHKSHFLLFNNFGFATSNKNLQFVPFFICLHIQDGYKISWAALLTSYFKQFRIERYFFFSDCHEILKKALTLRWQF